MEQGKYKMGLGYFLDQKIKKSSKNDEYMSKDLKWIYKEPHCETVSVKLMVPMDYTLLNKIRTHESVLIQISR